MKSKYLSTVKYGIISGLIILVLYAVIFSLTSGIYSWIEKPETIVDGKKMPTPVSDNWGEICATLMLSSLMVIIAVIMGTVAVMKIINKDIDLVNTLVVSAIVGMVSYFVVSTLDNAYLYVKSINWYINDYGLESAISHSEWVVNGYIHSLPGMIVIGAILSAIGGLLYFIYARMKNSGQKS